jgi:kynurenine formamidase
MLITMLIELSHVIRPGMVTVPGLPGPEITPHLTREESSAIYAPGTTFEINRISLVANTGTYLDSPVHRYADGADLSQLPLDRLANLPGVVVRAPGPAIDRATLAPYSVSGRAVLVHTGWDRHFGTEAYAAPGHPYLTVDAVDWLVARGAALVGIDSVNVDDTRSDERPAHSGLLAAGIPVVEHLTGLERLPSKGFRFHAAPPLLAGMGTFPVRAYAVVD